MDSNLNNNPTGWAANLMVFCRREKTTDGGLKSQTSSPHRNSVKPSKTHENRVLPSFYFTSSGPPRSDG